MKKIILLPVLLLVIFVVSIWNSGFPIGGDNVLPLNPLSNIEKSIYLWESWNQGTSQWRYTYFLWQLPFYLLSLLGLPVLVVVKIVITSYLVIGFVFTYLFFRLLFKKTKYDRLDLGIFCGFIFTLNAATLLVLPTTIYLQALPLCSYLMIKYLDTHRIRYATFFSLAISYAYFRHLPQARYLLIVLGVLFFVLLIYKQLRRISYKQMGLKLFLLFLFTFLLNTYILLPFIWEAFKPGGTYSHYTQNVTIYNGEADLHTATLFNISRFFTSSLVVAGARFGGFFINPFFMIWSSLLWIVAIFSAFFVKNKKEKKIIFISFLGCLFFIFIAKGANPPFGEIYKFLLFNLPLFKMFRTTADTIIGGTLFFSILATMAAYYITKGKQKLLAIILLVHVFIFSPIYLGYRLITFEGKEEVKKGFVIPDEYYQMGDWLNKIKDDVKILSLPLDDGYSYKDWSYIGQPIMAYLTKKPFIHGQVAAFSGLTDNLILQRMSLAESCYWTAINNIGFILKEKDSRIPEYSLSKFNFPAFSVLENSYFRLEKINPECFLPHIYVASNVFSFSGEKNSIPDVVRFIKNKQDIVIGLDNEPTSQIIEAYPGEIASLSDNVVTKKVFSDLSSPGPLNFWTYSFNAPTAGNYQMIIDNEGVATEEAKDLQKGNNVVKIPLLKSKNLIDESLFVGSGSATTFSQKIKDLQGDGLYLLFLEYKTSTASSILLSGVERERYFVGRLPFYELNVDLFVAQINHREPGAYEYQAILRTDNNAQTLSITLEKLLGKISIESFKIEKVTPPKVFFTRLKDEEKIIPPEITFERINPTKYRVKVEKATEPYHLVFSESFSPDWKAYVQQGKTSNNLLEEWRQKPIAEDQHLVVNGFANGWKIAPKDSQGKTNYTIIIEYWPQRLFYIGAIISILTVVICLFAEKLCLFAEKLCLLIQIMKKQRSQH